MICVYARNHLLTSIEHHIQYIHSPCAVNEKARGLVLAMCVYPFLARNIKSQEWHVLPRLDKRKSARDAVRGATTAPLGDKGCFYDRCAEHHPARNDTFRHPYWHILAITMYSTRKNWKTLKRAGIGLQRLQKIRAATTVFVLFGVPPVGYGMLWHPLEVAGTYDVLMMLMTYHDYDDDDVGNHDNNTSYCVNTTIYSCLYLLFHLFFIWLPWCHWITWTTVYHQNHPKPASLKQRFKDRVSKKEITCRVFKSQPS